MLRGLDHVVVAVNDLETSAKAWQDLGFTVTPEARHPWGTANRLIQLDGFFIELLGIADRERIEPAAKGDFSFGAFNLAFLESGRQGISMLVVDSQDPAQDRADYDRLGLHTYAQFSFERKARQPDGNELDVGFDLTFVTDPLASDLGFFSCHNRYPENFWKADYQSHRNGAHSIRSVVMVARDPSDHHEFLGGFTGQRDMRATSFGLDMDTARGEINVLNPRAYGYLYGEAALEGLPGALPVLGALEISCRGLDERRVIPAAALSGVSVVLVPES